MPAMGWRRPWCDGCSTVWRSRPHAGGCKDPKTGLQEWLQARKMRLPAYRVVETQGAAHQQTFDVECEIAELGLSERGIGGSRRAGEQAAAAAMLEILKTRNPR
jgi:ribonuclease-3